MITKKFILSRQYRTKVGAKSRDMALGFRMNDRGYGVALASDLKNLSSRSTAAGNPYILSLKVGRVEK